MLLQLMFQISIAKDPPSCLQKQNEQAEVLVEEHKGEAESKNAKFMRNRI